MSTLYIVATPIGNLDDLTLRSADVLRTAPVVVAEDTRVTRKLLERVAAKPKVVSFHRRSSENDVRRVVDFLDRGDVALVSDAGTPGVNDPGQAIVAAAFEHGHNVVPLPGPSSIMAALSVSGFYADQYVSYGFLPAGSGRRRRLLGQIAEQPMAAVLFETPHRLRGALEDMVNVLNDRKLVICREMTKLHEEIWRGTAVEALEYFSSPRGEFVIVVAPLGRTEQRPSATDVEDAEQRILEAASELEEQYSSRRDLVAVVAERTGLPKRQVYQALHRDA
jgi:16S rRNA (cytidine1402-2'-O)-methyltransferase